MGKYKEYMEYAREKDKTLLCDVFTKTVLIAHHDRSVLFFTHAFVEIKDEYIIVFTEHTGYHVFNIGDLNYFKYSDNKEMIFQSKLFQDMFKSFGIEL